MYLKIISTFFNIFLCNLLFYGFFIENVNAKTTPRKSDKTIITSDFMDIKRKSQKIEFIDNVIVKNGPDMMQSKQMTVFYKEEKQKNSEIKATNQKQAPANEIEKIVASGEVKVFTADFIANSDFGYYDPKNSLFILQENVVVNNGDSIGTGDKFIYSLKNRKGNFVGKKSKKDNLKKDNRVVIIIDKDAKKNKKKQNK